MIEPTDRLIFARTTLCNDDMSEIGTEARSRHIARLRVIEDAILESNRLTAALAAARKMRTPDYIYDPNNWDCTYAWGDREILVDDAPRDGTVFEHATFIHGPAKYAVYVVTERDEDGDEIDGDWQWFDSEEEATVAGKNASASIKDSSND